MSEEQAFSLIQSAIDKVVPGAGARVTPTTDILSEGILDSLDVMNFLFQVEKGLGRKITAIDEQFSDFRVGTLVKLISS